MKCKCNELGNTENKESVTVTIKFNINTSDAKETIREINHIATYYSMSIYEVMKVFGVNNKDLKWEIREN